MACRTKFVKRNTVTFPSLEFLEVTLRSDFENLREIEMHFRRKLFLKRLASLPCCGEIALTFKLPLLPSKIGAFTVRDSRKMKEILFVNYWLIGEIITLQYDVYPFLRIFLMKFQFFKLKTHTRILFLSFFSL